MTLPQLQAIADPHDAGPLGVDRDGHLVLGRCLCVWQAPRAQRDALARHASRDAVVGVRLHCASVASAPAYVPSAISQARRQACRISIS